MAAAVALAATDSMDDNDHKITDLSPCLTKTCWLLSALQDPISYTDRTRYRPSWLKKC